MRPKRLEKIKCPRCNGEYLPAEIYTPMDFLGKPKNILRDEEYKIVDFNNSSMDTVSQYVCDFCNCTFNVFASVNFTTSEQQSLNFDEEYAVPLRKNLFLLKED